MTPTTELYPYLYLMSFFHEYYVIIYNNICFQKTLKIFRDYLYIFYIKEAGGFDQIYGDIYNIGKLRLN